jgi:hypothetical protein
MKLDLLRACALAAASLGLCGVAHAEWTKTYVIDWYEPADYFGAKSGLTEPGTDCPSGTNPEINWVKVLMRAGYTEAEARWLRDPANPSREPNHGQNQMAFRGEHRENVYIKPWTTPDPGMVQVSGRIAEGFDLDRNASNGFSSPTGETGIDNNFYRALGCAKSYRGPPGLSSGAVATNDTMRNGGWTVLVVLHGAGSDPMNDDNVDVGLYMSGDKLVKDGNGDISPDYTFRIKPSKLEGIFKAKSANGVIATKAPMPEVWMRDPGGARDLQLLQAQLKLKLNPDDTLEGHIGGYRPWKTVYDALVNARGTVVEVLGWIELPAVYYALKRNADYSPTGSGGEKTHISYALRLHAIPAFAMTPDATNLVNSVVSYRANYPKSDDIPPSPAFGAIDGLIQRPGLPVGDALEKFPVPAEFAAKYPNPLSGGP